MPAFKTFAKHLAIVAAAALALFAVASICEDDEASAHDRGDFLPYLPTWAQKQAMNRGYGLYKLDTRSSQMPGYRAAIWACYGDIIEKTGIEWYEQTDPNGPVDLLYTMPDIVWDPGVVGQALYTNAPANIQVNFRAGITSWGTVEP